MRKLAFLSILALGFLPVCVHAYCGTPSAVQYNGNQKPDDDEFLYPTKDAYNKAVAGYENTNHHGSGYGVAIECDEAAKIVGITVNRSGGCEGGAVITLSAGHVFKGETIQTERSYQCQTTAFDDKWVVVDNSECETRWGKLKVGQQLKQKLAKTDCSGLTLTDDKGTEFAGVCRKGPKFVCKATKCVEGYTPDQGGICKQDKTPNKTSTCKSGPASSCGVLRGAQTCYNLCQNNGSKLLLVQKCFNPQYKEGKKKGTIPGTNTPLYEGCVEAENTPNPTQSCRASRSTPEGKACCDVSESVATWNGSKCVCTNPALDFKQVNGKWNCYARPDAPAYTCDLSRLSYVFSIQCEVADVKTQIDAIKSYCNSSGVAEDVFEDMMDKLYDLVETMCSDQSVVVHGCNSQQWGYLNALKDKCQNAPDVVARVDDVINYCKRTGGINPTELTQKLADLEQLGQDKCHSAGDADALKKKIADVRADMDKMQLGKSVWKNKEGNFNTTRLASDSIAGVVLGTAGGLITSNVVKKNQIKGGFERINCSIGGQTVASYGDEFNVGMSAR